MAEAPSALTISPEVLQRISDILASLRRLPGVEGVAVARRDGVMVSQVLPRTADPRRVASISAGLVGTADMAAEEIGRREASHTIVATVEGDIVVRKVGEEHVLNVILKPEANLGLILLHIGRASEALRLILTPA
jgi:predicted regulator of Ras-like GTPase activity (Roadblock/LC7/MglB family)